MSLIALFFSGKQKLQFSAYLCILPHIIFTTTSVYSSAPDTSNSNMSSETAESKLERKLPFTITTLGFGGIALKISEFNGQIAIMNGGRGSATINHRFTVGGGGYGIGNRIEIESSAQDTFLSVGMGYGGLELGYLLFPDEKRANVGISFLIAAGAAFIESLPKRKDNSFSIFPVLEPAVYGEISLSKLIRLHLGITYRYTAGSDLEYISDRDMRGLSGYINLLFGTCTCE